MKGLMNKASALRKFHGESIKSGYELDLRATTPLGNASLSPLTHIRKHSNVLAWVKPR